MGIYSITKSQSALTENFDAIQECASDNFLMEAYNNILENEENFNTLLQFVGVAELNMLETTGEVVYEASDFRGFGAKVKEFFKKIWEKIQAIYKKFFAMVGTFTKSNKDFVNKYKKEILTGDARGLEIKGYNYTIDGVSVKDADAAIDKVTGLGAIPSDESGLETYIKSVEDKDDILETMRGKALGKGKLDANEFRSELMAALRDGEDSKVTIDKINPSQQMEFLINEAAIVKQANEDFKALKKSIDSAIKEIDKDSKETIKNVPGESKVNSLKIKALNDKSILLKNKMAILEAVNGARLNAIKDRSRQAKSICVKLIGRKAKNESFSITNESGFLSGIQFK